MSQSVVLRLARYSWSPSLLTQGTLRNHMSALKNHMSQISAHNLWWVTYRVYSRDPYRAVYPVLGGGVHAATTTASP